MHSKIRLCFAEIIISCDTAQYPWVFLGFSIWSVTHYYKSFSAYIYIYISLNMRLAFRVLISIWKRTRSRRVTCPRAFRGSPVRRLREFEKWPLKTHSKMQKSKIIDGAILKNSDTTLVKHMLLSMPMSKTHNKITLVTDNLLKTFRKMTPLAFLFS